ncbi:MAG: efflux RND transporter periplasmic adaptor subunit, partial [Paracoccaceae bacterium]
RDTPEGVWLAGLPETANVIVVGQEYVRAGVKTAPTFREATQ